MAKKNGSTPGGKPGQSAEESRFLELFNSSSPEQQAAFLARAAKPPLQLIRLDYQYHEVTDLLSDLLEKAKAGQISGLVFAASMERGQGEPYMFGASGRLDRSQAEGIGAAVLLQHRLAAG